MDLLFSYARVRATVALSGGTARIPDSKSEFYVPLTLTVAQAFTHPELIVTADGKPANPDASVCAYLAATGNVLHVLSEGVEPTNAAKKMPVAGPALQKLSTLTCYNYLFSVQRGVIEQLLVPCRVSFPVALRETYLSARFVVDVISEHGCVAVDVAPCKSLTVKISNGVSLKIDNLNFVMENNKLVMSPALVKNLKQFVAISQPAAVKEEDERESVAAYMRNRLAELGIEPELRSIENDEAFVEALIARHRNGFTALQRFEGLLLVCMNEVYEFAVDLFHFLRDNELVGIYVFVAVNWLFISAINRDDFIAVAALAGIVIAFTAIALLRYFYDIDSAQWVVDHLCPTVYPQPSPAELEKYAEEISWIEDPAAVNTAIARKVDSLRLRPNPFKLAFLSVFSYIPELLFKWKEKNERGRASLISVIDNAVQKEVRAARQVEN